MSSTPQKTPVPLRPIPRDGMGSSAGTAVVLHLFLFLATALTGVSVAAMRTTSETEVHIAEI